MSGVALEYKTRKGNTAHTFFEVVLSPRPQGLPWRLKRNRIAAEGRKHSATFAQATIPRSLNALPAPAEDSIERI